MHRTNTSSTYPTHLGHSDPVISILTHYLLDEWSAAKEGKCSKWTQTLTTTTVGGGTGNFLPVYNFDWDNISWSGSYVLGSITLKLWETIEKDLRYNTSRIEVFCAIVQKQQQVNSSVVCSLVQALQKIRLTDDTRNNIENFGNKMAKMDHQISGTESAPIDISTLVATAFTN